MSGHTITARTDAMRTALFGYTSPNLGDDAQSLAAALFVGRPDCYVDRDRLDHVHLDEPHRLVMNSWFAIKRYEAVPPPNIDPVFFGFCIGRRELLNETWLSYLRRHQPIGCRDTETVAWLTERGISAHMTGCITLWLGHRLEAVPAAQRSGIYMIDVPEEIEHAIPIAVRGQAVRLTQAPSNALRWAGQKERFRELAHFYNRLRSAELVLTKRLHTMLPCVAFGTPVIGFINAERSGDKNMRFGGYEHFLNLLRYKDRKLLDVVDWSLSLQAATIPEPMQTTFRTFLKGVGCNGTRRYCDLQEAVEDLIPGDDATPRYPRRWWGALARDRVRANVLSAP